MDLLSRPAGRAVSKVAATVRSAALACARTVRASAWPAVASVAAVALPPGGVSGQGLTRDEALRLAFPEADSVVRRTAYLDEGEVSRAGEWAGPEAPVDVGVVSYYVAMREGRASGVAYFDAHRVRTLPEVLMFVVGPDHRIRRTEVVRFSEPPEYRPPGGWLEQLDGRALDEALSLKGDVAGITGATLTARAVTAAARRVLALHAVIAPFEGAR
ncbi:MAG TPA: FMN-binding protein [Longimicrobiales bacterium]|nr:FMN-binding protein [Longimicrobiales bacterium]